MKCYFCNQEILDPAKLAAGMTYGVCPVCPHQCTTVYWISSGEYKLFFGTIQVLHKNKEYIVAFSPPTNEFFIKQTVDSGNKKVMQLSFLPNNITPHNILTKLPTLLVWS